MFNSKIVILCVFLLSFTNIEGLADGYHYYPNLQAYLKLHREPVDWQTARMKCHDEDAILAAPRTDTFWSSLLEEVLTPNFDNNLPKAIYAGEQIHFPDGIYVNENGKQIVSRRWQDTVDLARCVVYHFNGTRQLVDCQQPYAYVCHASTTSSLAVTRECKNFDYELNNKTGSCYKFHKNCKTWDEAYKICKDEGAHLVIINSDTEAKELVDLYAKYPLEMLIDSKIGHKFSVLAVGFYYWKDADTYITIEGSTIEEAGYAKWSNYNPSNRGLSDYRGGMFRSGLLDDARKDIVMPFICEENQTHQHPYMGTEASHNVNMDCRY